MSKNYSSQLKCVSKGKSKSGQGWQEPVYLDGVIEDLDLYVQGLPQNHQHRNLFGRGCRNGQSGPGFARLPVEIGGSQGVSPLVEALGGGCFYTNKSILAEIKDAAIL